ncbi:DUF2336 domain-containing protein [Dongia sedimenti]|uniref:DUF2336 domain-containing protein n=1 Tax=Dongia sedimenti TaxID=3064282 RepID=A0ABU0YKE5_9PROT|nr:DUF2336 domain-containing protein [Rhodospirillaceae bacterium R-7]
MQYEEAKRLAGSAEVAARRDLASRDDIAPEILFFLCRDADVGVRLAVAGNRRTPPEADIELARDADDAVRARVGEKLGEARPVDLPPLTAKKQALAIETIEALAVDNSGRVREAIARALRLSIDAPPHIVQALARDIEIKVAAPILQNSPLLGDGDLVDIMNSGPIKGVLNAIAKRRNVGQGVTELLVNRAIATPGEESAVADLLANETARIGAGTMDKIIDVAPGYGDWHGALAARKDLTSDNLQRVAAIPSDAIAETLSQRSDLDDAAMAALSSMVARRMAELTKKREEEAPAVKPAADKFLITVMKSGKIGPVGAAISLRAGIPTDVTMRILTSKNPKALVALAWKAGLSAAQAQSLQTHVGGISPQTALGPTTSGGYPIAHADMEWQLGLYLGN